MNDNCSNPGYVLYIKTEDLFVAFLVSLAWPVTGLIFIATYLEDILKWTDKKRGVINNENEN